MKLSIFQRLFLPRKKEIESLIDKIIDELRFIETNDKGIIITNSDKEVVEQFNWYDIKDVELVNGFSEGEISFTLNNGEQKSIPEEHHESWYELLKKIPQGFSKYDYEGVRAFFDNLKGCEICGMMSVYEGECLACGEEEWKEEFLDEYESKEEYIRELQLDEFEPIDDEEAVISNKPKSGFKSFEGWKLMINSQYFNK